MRAQQSKLSAASSQVARDAGSSSAETRRLQELRTATRSGAAPEEGVRAATVAKHSAPSGQQKGGGPRQQQGAMASSSGVRPPAFKGAPCYDEKTVAIAKMMAKAFGIPAFKVDPEEAAMVTLRHRSELRDAALKKLLSVVPVDTEIVIADTHGGVGGDSLAFWEMLRSMSRNGQILITQPVEEGGRTDRLLHNLAAYKKAASGPGARVEVTLKRMCFEKMVADKLDPASGLVVHLLYVDPPWELPTGFVSGKQYGSAAKPSPVTMSLIRRIATDVFEPLEKKKALPPWYVCLKVPTPFVEFSLALKEESRFMRDYELFREIPSLNRHGQPVYYTLVFKHIEVCLRR